MHTLRPLVLNVVLLLACSSAGAQWQSVAPGIEYAEFTAAGPNRLFVARLDRNNPDAFIESSIGQGRLSGGLETVSGMANRYEDALNYWGQSWGQRNDVVVAINGDFFSYTTALPTSGQIYAGGYAKRFADFTGGSGFTWKFDRSVFIGECVRNVPAENVVHYPASSQDQKITAINAPPAADKMTMFTPQFGATTGTGSTVDEVLVELEAPPVLQPSPAYVRGWVRARRLGQGSTVLPFDHVVLCADGDAASKLRANTPIGAEVRLSQKITHYTPSCGTPNPNDWTGTYAAIGGSFYFLKAGVVQTFTDPGATQRHPRTAIAYNDRYVFFIVCDGRNPGVSEGMSMAELGAFCVTQLGATYGTNQDGGGSSAIWVNGQVKNQPSDGSERAVANGMMMVVRKPMQQSTRFHAGDPVETTTSVNVRTGPGTNYAILTTVGGGTEAAILSHPLMGVRATAYSWWKCDVNGTTGWMAEPFLSLVTPPTVPADFDQDGDVDLTDYNVFQYCFAGPGYVIPYPECAGVDLDDDGDIDLTDFLAFQACFNGANNPPACAP